MNYTKQEIELILEADRRLRVADFWEYCRFMDGEFFNADRPHLKRIASVLQDMEDGKLEKNLMISMPPRAGKSYIISQFCAWALGRHPKGSIMRNSYAAELAEKFSYDIREIVQSAKYIETFPGMELKRDKKAVSDWSFKSAKQTSYFCGGVGGAITGKGCDLYGILDDPVKNIEDALSENIMNKTHEWYTSTHLSRMETGCKQIIIMTRWSVHDTAGKVTEAEGEHWIKIVIPALIDGETFCKAVHTTEEYLKLKNMTDDFIWEAEYMQSPYEVKGLLFSELQEFDVAREGSAKLAYIDVADKGKDYICLVGGNVIVSEQNEIDIDDVYFSQEGTEITEDEIVSLLRRKKYDICVIESNSAGEIFARNIRNKLRGECRIETKFNSKNKETRIFLNSGFVKTNFRFKRNPDVMYQKFLKQLKSYIKDGRNLHDDGADAITGLAIEAQERKFSVRPKPKSVPNKYYTEDELKDLGYNRRQIREYLKKEIPSFERGEILEWGGTKVV